MTLSPTATLRPIAALLLMLLLAGCATTAERTPGDPFEPANRQVHAFNTTVDRATLRPVAKAYVETVPQPVRTSVSNFFFNLTMPRVIVNQLLQGKPKQAGQDTLRFVMNLTLGIGGLFDPAGDANLPRHDEDLGQTLGLWGVPPGPFLMLPFLGPAHLRDLPSVVADRFLEPFYWYNYGNERWISLAISLVDLRARLLPLDDTLRRAYDPYAFIRDAYTQRRLYQVFDGNIPERFLQQEDEYFEDESDVPDEEPATSDPQAPPPATPPEGQPD
jgi:phospholipid-binding lipoprotein MlaA